MTIQRSSLYYISVLLFFFKNLIPVSYTHLNVVGAQLSFNAKLRSRWTRLIRGCLLYTSGTVIVTYRCNARCSMCNRYKAPSKPEEEISIETIKKLPKMYFTNITGGEPFIRTDLKDIVRELYKKSDRIVISTNGFFTDRIVDLCKAVSYTHLSHEKVESTYCIWSGVRSGSYAGADLWCRL